MELRQLEYFVAVAEEANFTRAAERVHISQSGVSAQIRRLEDELGVTLFDRAARAATLTDAGSAALPHARAALAAVAGVHEAVDEITGLVRGRLTVGMVVGCRVGPLFDALGAFHRDHPGVELSLFEDNSDVLVHAVMTGGADLALVAAAGALPDGLPGFPIVSEGLVAAMPLDHPLATRGAVRLRDLSGHPIVCLPAGTGIRTAFDASCAARGVDVSVVLTASAPETVADLAARGLGVAVLSETTAAGRADVLHIAPIGDAKVPAVLGVVWSSAPGPALERLVGVVRAAFAR